MIDGRLGSDDWGLVCESDQVGVGMGVGSGPLCGVGDGDVEGDGDGDEEGEPTGEGVGVGPGEPEGGLVAAAASTLSRVAKLDLRVTPSESNTPYCLCSAVGAGGQQW